MIQHLPFKIYTYHLWTFCPEVLYFHFWTFCPEVPCNNADKLSCNADYFKYQHHTANQTAYDTVQSKNTNATTDTEILRYQPQAHPVDTKRTPRYNPI